MSATRSMFERNVLILRDHQNQSTDQTVRAVTEGRDMLVSKPTGSGKSIEIMALVARLLPLGWHIVIAAPQVNILDNFKNKGQKPFTHVKYGSQVVDITGQPLVQEKLDAKDISRYLKCSDVGYALALTQQALVRFDEANKWPNLDRCLLIIDEFHHAGADGLGRIAQKWRSKGGQVAGYTATPWRTDGRQVGWVDENMSTYYLSLAEHMAKKDEQGFGKYCPSTLHSEFVGYAAAEVTDDNFSGSSLTKREAESIAESVYGKWVRDKKPKFVLYYQSSTTQRNQFIREAVLRKFKKAGERVIDSTGEERGEQFNDHLAEERGRTYKESKFAGIVGCGRVREGMDWPHCSAVYVIGMPTSTNLLVQLFGRACRKKDADYKPAAYRDLAEISFFLPSADDGKTFDHISQVHSWNTLAVCFFLTDSSLGQRSIGLRHVGAGIRKAVKDAKKTAKLSEDIMSASLAQDATYSGKSVENEVLLQILDLADQGMLMDEIADVMNDWGYDPEAVKSALVQQGLIEHPETAEYVERAARRLARAATKISIPQISSEVFNSYVHEFRSLTLKGSSYSKTVSSQLHQVGGVKALVDGLRGREVASEEEVRKLGHGMTGAQYNEERVAKSKETGKLYPHSRDFPRHYEGMTFREVMTGLRRDGETAHIEEIREFGQNMTRDQYNQERVAKSKETGKVYPPSHNFPEHYEGMTFQEVMTGRRMGSDSATVEEIREFAKGMTGAQYNEERVAKSKETGKLYPEAGAFSRHYEGMTFREVMTGLRRGGETAHIEEIREFAKGMTVSQYDEKRFAKSKETGKRYPQVGEFPELYCMTFQEVVTGRRKGGEVAIVEEIREFAKGMTGAQYNEERVAKSKETGKLYPHFGEFPRHYNGLTFTQVRDGVAYADAAE